MKLYQAGLSQNQVWREISRNSVISRRIDSLLDAANDATAQLVLANHETAKPSDLAVLRVVYDDLGLGDDSHEFPLAEANLQKLRSVFIEHPEPPRDVSRAVDTYGVLAAAAAHSNNVIYNTLVLKLQLAYWEGVNGSSMNRLVFYIQQLPARVWQFALRVWRVALLYNSLLETMGNVWHQDLVRLNPVDTILRPQLAWRRTKAAFRMPITIAASDIGARIADIKGQIEANLAIIDGLVKVDDYTHTPAVVVAMEAALGITNPAANANQRVLQIIDDVIASESLAPQRLWRTAPPRVWLRYWPVIIVALWYGPRLTEQVTTNWRDYVAWAKHNLWDTAVGFFENWVVTPLTNMFSILRQDLDMSITSRELLQLDLELLERMLSQYVTDFKLPLSDEQVHQAVALGDMTVVMLNYEQEIRRPLCSLASGDLVRSLLIQLQKTKVDGGLAITGIDKLLKLQQLLFGVVSALPLAFALYKLWGWMFRAKPLMVDGKQVTMLCLRLLNAIENYLVRTSDGEFCEGDLLVEVLNLMIISRPLIPKPLWLQYVGDLNDLNNARFKVETKLRLMQKIWNMYSPYFR